LPAAWKFIMASLKMPGEGRSIENDWDIVDRADIEEW
jgi:hypothetical protein